MGAGQKKASADDLDAMKKLVEQAMQHGALGVSTSLQYVPGRFADTDEIVELAKVAKQYGGIYISHQRSESGADHRVARRSVRGGRAGEYSR